MEIVRQRRKRLLAWILTLVLCVGMWQGNVQAEGDGVGDGAPTSPEVMTTEVPPAEVPPTEAEPTEGGDESANPVVASETGDGVMPVADTTTTIVRLVDNNSMGFSAANNSMFKVGDVSGTLTNGAFVFTNPFVLSSAIYKNGSYVHNLIEWRNGESGDSIAMGTNYNVETSVYAALGSSIVASFWKGTKDNLEVISGIETKVGTQSSQETVWKIQMPNWGDNNGFITGWRNVTVNEDGLNLYGDIIYVGEEYISSYDDFEKEIKFAGNYSTYVDKNGEYYLYPQVTYQVRGGADWMVSLNGNTDGYTYVGTPDGKEFYIAGEVTDTSVAQPYAFAFTDIAE